MPVSARKSKNRVLAAVVAAAGLFVWVLPSSAETIAVIGTGNVGGALGPQFAKLGHTMIYGSRQPDRDDVQALVARTTNGATAMQPADAAARASVVVIAVPWAYAEDAVKSLGNLTGKIIIDPTNAVRRDDQGIRHHAVETSAGQMIQGWAPGAKVVKAFNTLSSDTMADPASAGGPMTIPIVGDDADAKAFVAGLARGMGFDAVDMGGIEFAHAVEEMLIVRGNAGVLGTPFNYYFRPVP